MLATFVGVANEPKADPSDSSYIPRPEWYFLFLFQLLKYFPGVLEWVGTTIIPAIAVLALLLLPFYDQNPYRHWKKRLLAISIMSVIVLGMIALTLLATISTPSQAETGTLAVTLPQKISAGSDLFSIQCAECHGPEGEGGEIKGVAGLEGRVLEPINSKDVMYTRTDETLSNIISYGQPDLGMPGFSKAYGGELSVGDIDAIVAFMRYTWDDRSVLPKEVVPGAIPTLAAGEAPNYDTHIAPIIKKYCSSCHRAGKTNNNYTMGSYEEMMTSGDHAPNVIPGNLNSNLIRMINRETIDAGGPMPPSKTLSPELITMFELWVKAGAPKTAAQVTPVGTLATVTPGATLTATLSITPGTPIKTTATPPQATTPLAPELTQTPLPPSPSATHVSPQNTPTEPPASLQPTPTPLPPSSTPTPTITPTLMETFTETPYPPP